MYKLEMVFKRENHELLPQKILTQVIQRNPTNRTPILVFNRTTVFAITTHEIFLKRTKNKYVQVGNGFHT